MKLTIFGGTGRAGKHLVEQALKQGHQVTLLARNPAKLEVQDDHLTIIAGDVKDPACTAQAIAGAEAVISVLGPTSNEPVLEVSQGMRNILNAMQQQGVRRLVISAGAGVRDPQDAPGLFDRVMGFLVKRMAGNVFADMQQTVDLVRASDLDWTVVRVPMLTDAPASGKVKVGYVGKGSGPRLSRADLAKFMLEQVEADTYLRQAPAIWMG